jgi:DNA-binding transcriptional LysR family regulator
MVSKTPLHGYGIEDLRVFCEVVRLGSFTGAARALHYTQSGVSRRMASLERATGGPLFARQARGVRLAPAGVVLHRHALDILGRLTPRRLVRPSRSSRVGRRCRGLSSPAPATVGAVGQRRRGRPASGRS